MERPHCAAALVGCALKLVLCLCLEVEEALAFAQDELAPHGEVLLNRDAHARMHMHTCTLHLMVRGDAQ